MRRNPFAHIALLAAPVLLLTFAGCDNAVDPFVEESQSGRFAVYGYLDASADTQFVRISPLIESAGYVYGDSLGADVILTNLTTGTRTRMRGTSVSIGDGRRAYVFHATSAVSVGSAFRLDVFYPGRDTTTVVTQVPGPDQIEAGVPAPDVRGFIVQRVRWTAIHDVREVVVTYTVETERGPIVVEMPYGDPEDGEAFATDVRLERDRDVVLRSLPAGIDTAAVTLEHVGISAEMLSPEWQNAGTSAREFFGSVARVGRSWTLPDSTAARIGYRLP